MKFSDVALSRPVRGFVVLLLIIVIGTIGYTLIEGWSFLDSLFMTVTTLSTVGYSEVHPLSSAGRIFSIFLILGGVGVLFYILADMVRYVLEGELGVQFGRRRMELTIQKLKNHFIICGYGRVGESIATILNHEQVEFVVIDKRDENIEMARKHGYLAMNGDAANDEILRKAQIHSARAIIIALGNDVDNTYTTLTARELNPMLPIIVRANSEEAKKKLRLAGASHIVAPETIGGQRMARLALKPKATEFVDSVIFGMKQQLVIEEIDVGDNSNLSGYSIHQVEEHFPDMRILALKKHDGSIISNPNGKALLHDIISLLVFGPQEQLLALEQWCASCKLTS